MPVTLAAGLEKALPLLADRWAGEADAAYPFATAGLLHSRQDAFANPIGQRSRAVSEILFRAILGLPHDGKVLRAALEEFVRVRAIQDMEPESALGVMFSPKRIIRAWCREQNVPMEGAAGEWEAMDERCDTLALLAFGLYARSREAFFTARLEDYKRRHRQIDRLAARHGLLTDREKPEPADADDGAGQPGSKPDAP